MKTEELNSNLVTLSIQMTPKQFVEIERAFDYIIHDAIMGNGELNIVYDDDCKTEKDNLTGNRNSKDKNPFWPSCITCAQAKEGASEFSSQLNLVTTFLKHFGMDSIEGEKVHEKHK